MNDESLYDSHAWIDAVALYWDADLELWRLKAVGSLCECQQKIEELKKQKPDAVVRIYEVDSR